MGNGDHSTTSQTKDRTHSDRQPGRLATVAFIWLLVTVLAEIAVAAIEWQPFAASREATISDDAFNLLMVLATPVFTFVIVVGGYALLRDRHRGDDADGPPIRTSRAFIATWLVVTTVLSVVVIITPGFTGLDELRAEPEADLVIDVRAERWSWAYRYADSGVETQGNLMLPINRRVLFRISSTDVIHSFWIPAFRIKKDAVPGQITTTMVTPRKLGSFDNQEEMRVQCAELCGVGHARMFTGVTVVEQDEFDAWLAAAGG